MTTAFYLLGTIALFMCAPVREVSDQTAKVVFWMWVIGLTFALVSDVRKML